MTDAEHAQLRRKADCLDGMFAALERGGKLFKANGDFGLKDGALYVAENQCNTIPQGSTWPSLEEIGALVTERDAIKKRLAEYAVGATQ